MFSDTIEERILRHIHTDELVELAVALGNIYSPTGCETEIASFIHQWMEENKFEPRLVGATEGRANVLGRYKGTGGGPVFAFNSHMDITMGKNEIWRLKTPDQRIYYEAWLDGNEICGNGVVNDKGPMAAWMIAAKAIRKSGIELKGDILLCAVVGEIGFEPVDEFEGPKYIGKEFGSRYLLNHGGTADCAIVAEATGFKAGWVEAGKAFYKVTLYGGPSKYTPYVDHAEHERSANAIVRVAKFIPALEQWALTYETRNRKAFKGGSVIPKASIGAVRGGLPYQITRPPELCSLYLDVRLVPDANPLDIREELLELLSENDQSGEVELYLHRPGFECKGVDQLLQDVGRAYRFVNGCDLTFPPDPPITSMWRDTNVYAEFGIPSITFGPGGGGGSGTNRLSVNDLIEAAKVYALAAYYVCRRTRSSRAG